VHHVRHRLAPTRPQLPQSHLDVAARVGRERVDVLLRYAESFRLLKHLPLDILMVVPAAEECDAEMQLAHGKAVRVDAPHDKRAVRTGPMALRPDVRDKVEEW